MLDVLSDSGSLAVPILALVGLVVLAAIVVWIGRRARRNRSHGLVAGHRLAVIDQVQIDETRRLVLIQRDEVQHLVVLGGGSDFLVESGIGAVHAREPLHPHAPARAGEAARPPEPAPVPVPEVHRASDFRTAEPSPAREPTRAAREAPAPAPRPPRPIPLPPEARAPVEPRPATFSRGPARDIALEPVPMTPAPVPSAPLSSAPPVPPLPRRPVDVRPLEPDITARTPPAPPPVAQRAEPIIEPPAEAEVGARVTVKVDPLFADMADQLEEALRRPAAPDGEPARRTAPPRAPESRKVDEPRPAFPAAGPAPAIVTPAAAAPKVATPAFAPAIERPEPRPEARASDVPAPEIRPDPRPTEARPAEARPAESRPAEASTPESRALDIFAPQIRATEAPAPEIDIAEPRGANPGDPFEEEMANLLGRSRRP